jgi:hypothetical protein
MTISSDTAISRRSEGVFLPTRERRPGRWPIALGWLAQVVIRLWVFWPARVPAAYPDEAGYLVAARRLAGGPGGDLSHLTFYPGGYPLLLSPVYRITADPVTAYRLVVGVGAVAGALVFPLSVAILRRLGAAPATAYVIAFAVALLPANVFFGAWALTDAILPAVVACWLLALVRFADTGGRGTGCAASLAAAYAYAVHSRGIVILLVHAGILGFLLIRGWSPRRHVMVAAVVAAAGGLSAWWLNTLILRTLYPSGPKPLGAILWSRLTSAGGLPYTLSGACGQVWYLIVATDGLAGLGLVAAAAQLASRRADRPVRLGAAAVLATTVGIALATTAALPDEHRVGNYAYGRYLACVAIPLALAGAATLVRAGRRTVAGAALATGAALAVTTLVVFAYAGPRLHDAIFIAFDFPEISYLTADQHSLDMVTAGLVSGALGGCLIALRRAPGLMAALLLAVNGGFVVQMAHTTVRRPATGARPPLMRGHGVEASPGTDWRTLVELRYRVGWTTVAWLSPGGPRPGTCTVITAWHGGAASAAWPGHPSGWAVTDRRPDRWVSWRRMRCGAQDSPPSP